MKEYSPDELFNFDEYMKRLSEESQPSLFGEDDNDEILTPEQTFHHSTCKNSRCTTCDLTKTCEVFNDLADLSMRGYSSCMAECDDYKPVKFNKLPDSKKGFDNRRFVN